MIFLLFQLLDLLTAVVLVLAQFGLVSWQILLYHGSYLIAKGIWYHTDPLSWIDAGIGLYLILMIFGLRSVFSFIAAGYFLYKLSLYLIYS